MKVENKTPIHSLSQKEIVFCRLVALGETPAQAATRAGYVKRSYGNTLIKKEKIQETITHFKQNKNETVPVAENEEILQFLTNIMRGDEYEQKKDSIIKDRMKAAELLGKRLHLFESNEQEEEAKVIIIDDIARNG